MDESLNIIVELLLPSYLAIISFSNLFFGLLGWLFGRVEISQLINNWDNLSFINSIILCWAIFIAFLSSFAGWVGLIYFLSGLFVFFGEMFGGDHRFNQTKSDEKDAFGKMIDGFIVLLIAISVSCISYFSLLTFNQTSLEIYELLIAFLILGSISGYLIYKYHYELKDFILFTIASYLPIYFFVLVSIVLSKLNDDDDFPLVVLLVGISWGIFDGISKNIANFNSDDVEELDYINGFINEFFDGKTAIQNAIKWVYIGFGSGFYIFEGSSWASPYAVPAAMISALILGMAGLLLGLVGGGGLFKIWFLWIYIFFFIVAYCGNLIAFF